MKMNKQNNEKDRERHKQNDSSLNNSKDIGPLVAAISFLFVVVVNLFFVIAVAVVLYELKLDYFHKDWNFDSLTS